jgi:hypothetical protein
MEEKPIKLPKLDELKELLKDTKNIIWYKRANIEGPKESIEYLNRKIQELNTLLSTDNVNHISSSL